MSAKRAETNDGYAFTTANISLPALCFPFISVQQINRPCFVVEKSMIIEKDNRAEVSSSRMFFPRSK